MTTNKASLATGATHEDENLRRRNIDSHKETNGTISVSKVEVDDKKDHQVLANFLFKNLEG